MEKRQKIILLGDSAFAEVGFEYFAHDSPYEVIAFAVERDFRTHSQLCGRPVIDLEDIEKHYPPSEHAFHAVIAYHHMNRVRARLVQVMYDKGYESVSYISSDAKVWPSARIGRHCFIFENNVVQPFAKIGDNCVLWSGGLIGHHSTLGNNCFLSHHVAIAGFSKIGDYCFLGINSTISDSLEIGNDCLVGAGAVVARTLQANTIIRPVTNIQRQGAKIRMKVE